MYEHMHVYLHNVVFDCISLIRTKCLWHLTNGVRITEDSLYIALHELHNIHRIKQVIINRHAFLRHETSFWIKVYEGVGTEEPTWLTCLVESCNFPRYAFISHGCFGTWCIHYSLLTFIFSGSQATFILG